MLLNVLLSLSAGAVALAISKSYWQTPVDGLDVLIAIFIPLAIFGFTSR